MAKVIVLVCFVSAASARQVHNVNRYLEQPVNSEIGTSARDDRLIQRRTVEYGSGGNNFPYRHKESYNYNNVPDHSNVQNQEKINDSYNYIGYENEFRLRTSLDQPEGSKLEDVNVELAFRNGNTKIDNNDRRELENRGTTTQRASVKLPYEGTLKTNVDKVNLRRNMSSIRGRNRTRGEALTNQDSQLPETVPEAVRGVEMSNKDENETWVWGMDTESATKFLPDDGLDDRVALAGDRCPSGFAKIGGKCVEKQ